ncbi:MAG TPA: hypothetical protein PLG09_03120 [Syntrophomonadaceae bacterium]|nr:hypothetical protein [Syntrophomonadaceae bacterium]HPU48642.1 hypothetical protein [Syntrophomonadaceae bacterium]
MNLIVGKSGFWFIGRMDDLITLLSAYPPETTLADFIRLNLH